MFDLDTLEGRDSLKSFLRNATARVVFTKGDGSERVMKCTLRGDVAETTNSGRPRKSNPYVLNVWDIEAKGWRSFRWDSVKAVLFDI